MSKDPMQVRLGVWWSRFAYPRDDMQMLGTVQQGAQIGALARLPDGNYAQVNGDVIEPLNARHIENALRATGGLRSNTDPAPSPPRPSTVPTVIVKKRRRLDAAQRRSDDAVKAC